MSGVSTYFSHKILDNILGRVPYSPPTLYYIELSKTPLGIDGIGASPPIGGNYSRLTIPNNKTSFGIATNKIVPLVKEFSYNESTNDSSGDWGIITHDLIYDNITGGNVLLYGQLQNSRSVERQSTLILPAIENQFGFDICGGSTTDMAITTYASNLILDYLFGASTLNIPSTFYVGISTTSISVDGLGYTEPVGGSYARVALINDKNTFTNATNKTLTLAKEFKFNTATVPWGIVTHYFISDALTGGNIWWIGKLLNNRTVEIATTLVMKPSSFVFTLDSCPSGT